MLAEFIGWYDTVCDAKCPAANVSAKGGLTYLVRWECTGQTGTLEEASLGLRRAMELTGPAAHNPSSHPRVVGPVGAATCAAMPAVDECWRKISTMREMRKVGRVSINRRWRQTERR